jgi:anthranilate phosphoribosyltransferase
VLGVNIAGHPGLDSSAARWTRPASAFLFAPAHHGAMRHVSPIRATSWVSAPIFNLLGPLTNPAGAKRQVIGRLRAAPRRADRRGPRRAGRDPRLVVHGQGLDELTTTGETEVAEWRDGGVRRFTVTPEAAGLPRASLDDLAAAIPSSTPPPCAPC